MLKSNPKPPRCIRITCFSLSKMLFIMIVNICWYFFDIFLSSSVSPRFSRWMRFFLSKLRKYESLQFLFGSLPNNGNNTQLLLSLLLYAHLSFVRKKEKNGLPVLIHIFLLNGFWTSHSIHRFIYDLWIYIIFFRWNQFLVRKIYRKTHKKT